jgi:hypothetical protein
VDRAITASGGDVVSDTTTVDLAAWLTAIWDEEEADTRNLTVAGIESGWETWLESGQSVGDKTGYVVAYEVRMGAARRHIVRNDPASVLARIAADRKILELHTGFHECPSEEDNCGWITDDRCATVRLLASPYKGREGWQEAWEHE